MKSLKQHIQETSTERADTPAQTFPMTLRDFIDSLEFFDNKDRIVEVFIESPVENAICVKFPSIEEPDQEQPCAPGNRMIQNETVESPEAPTDQREPRITNLSWIVAELKSEIGNFADNYSVDISMDSSQPGKILMVFQKREDGCED